jgi:hypothetical protein
MIGACSRLANNLANDKQKFLQIALSASVLKTVGRPKRPVGSNPTPAARYFTDPARTPWTK